MDERDARLERLYDFDREGEPSTMAYVSGYAQQLVGEFMEFREQQYQLHRTDGESILETLTRWEVIRFGSTLFPSAHGVLSFWVRVKLAPEHGGRRLPKAGYFDAGGPGMKCKRCVSDMPPPAAKVVQRLLADPEKAADKAARDMPHAPGRKAYERRVAELEQQRDGLNLDVDGAR